jgi:hypothetical protein
MYPELRILANSRNFVKNLPPKYTDIELQSILYSDLQLPDRISEQDFSNDIKDNAKIKWRVNHFLFKKELLPFLLDNSAFKKWKNFKSSNWLIGLLIIGFAIWAKDYKILFFLIIYPFLIIPLDHWIFIFNMTVVIAVKLFFKIGIPYFWFFVTLIAIGYLLNKAIDEMIEKKILKKALNDWPTFWKYYSNKIIWMDESALNNEYHKLTEKYSELRD